MEFSLRQLPEFETLRKTFLLVLSLSDRPMMRTLRTEEPVGAISVVNLRRVFQLIQYFLHNASGLRKASAATVGYAQNASNC